jgi:hypothetical protein
MTLARCLSATQTTSSPPVTHSQMAVASSDGLVSMASWLPGVRTGETASRSEWRGIQSHSPRGHRSVVIGDQVHTGYLPPRAQPLRHRAPGPTAVECTGDQYIGSQTSSPVIVITPRWGDSVSTTGGCARAGAGRRPRNCASVPLRRRSPAFPSRRFVMTVVRRLMVAVAGLAVTLVLSQGMAQAAPPLPICKVAPVPVGCPSQ